MRLCGQTTFIASIGRAIRARSTHQRQFFIFEGIVTAVKMALERFLADRRSACTMPAAAIGKQTIPCMKSRWKETGR